MAAVLWKTIQPGEQRKERIMKKLLLYALVGFFAAVQAAQAATPKDTLVMASQIDDIITLDPAEIF
jgi:peptide/nickel transport system substrate-binding protein